MNCPYCEKKTHFLSSLAFYGRDYGNHVYVCFICDAYVGTHRGTKKPLGTPAKKELRQLRKQCHSEFDRLWKKGKMSRSGAYRWLSIMMEVPKEKAHIAMFDESQCRKLLKILK